MIQLNKILKYISEIKIELSGGLAIYAILTMLFGFLITIIKILKWTGIYNGQ